MISNLIKNKKTFLKTIKIILIIIFIIVLLFSALVLANKDKIVYGIKIANTSLGGLSYEKAKIKFENAIEKFLNKEIILRYQNKIYTISFQEIDINIFIDSSLKEAFEIGHQQNLLSNISKQFFALFGRYNLNPDYQINQEKLENFIQKNLKAIDNPAVNAGWEYNEQTNNFVFISSHIGNKIDRKDLELKLCNKIKNLSSKDIYIEIINDSPEIYQQETKQAYEKAQEIINNAPYVLIIDSFSKEETIKFTLTKEEIASLLRFFPKKENNSENIILGVSLDQEQLKKYLTVLAPLINQKPINAKFKVQNNKVVEFSLSQDGIKLKIEENASKLKKEIVKNLSKEIELEIKKVPPEITSENANDLGITSLLGDGMSNFYGSSNIRIHNINIGTAMFNGILLKPDEELSFNEILGEIGPEQGYKPELVIKRNKTIPEYGGGLCQVSTTAFRAAIKSGLKITERYPHAFPVKYYDPQGFDATIYPPHPDLKFINNTPKHLLIQTKIEDYNLIFEFYGTNDDKKIIIEGPYQYDIKPGGSMKTMLTRKIYKYEELIDEETWYSNYKSPSLYPVQQNPLE